MSKFNRGYEELLREQYPSHTVDQIVRTPRLAPRSEDDKRGVPYVRVEDGFDPCYGTPDDWFYVPGFGEGVVNKASFAAESAMCGANFILPGQNRQSIKGDAVDTQADNYLAVIDHLRPEQKPKVYLPHSFGGQIFDRMVQKRPALFQDAHVVMLAPSGTIAGETYPEIGRRWLKFMKSESDKNRYMEFPDPKNVTGMASTRVLASNPIRTAKEVRAMRHNFIDYIDLRRSVASLAVVSYAEDEMFPSKVEADEDKNETFNASQRLRVSMGALVNMYEEDILWVTPYNSSSDSEGEVIGARGATHDDEQFSPSRVVATIKDILAYQISPRLNN